MGQEGGYGVGLGNRSGSGRLARLERRPRVFGTAILPAVNAMPPLAVFTLSFLAGLALLALGATAFALPAGVQVIGSVSLASLALSLLAALACGLGILMLVRMLFARDAEDCGLGLEVNAAQPMVCEKRRTHLRVLGLADQASEEEIRQAFRSLVRRCHPDLHPNDPRALAVFRRAMAARDALLAS